MKDYKDYSLLNHNTFGIDAKCNRFLEYSSVDEAQKVSEVISNDNFPFLIIGCGSNLLLKSNYKGNVVLFVISIRGATRSTPWNS